MRYERKNQVKWDSQALGPNDWQNGGAIHGDKGNKGGTSRQWPIRRSVLDTITFELPIDVQVDIIRKHGGQYPDTVWMHALSPH